MFRCTAILFAALVVPSTLDSQPRGASAPGIGYRIHSRLVLLPLTVTDRQGRQVSGLRAEDFVVSENNRVQQVSSFSEQDEPVSLGIVVDTSGSMKDVLAYARECLRYVVDQLGPDDEAFLYLVGSQPDPRTKLSADFEKLPAALQFVRADGNTALIDTIWAGLDHIHSARRQRKALLVISDGIDNHSRISAGTLLSRVVESDVQISTIALYAARNRKPIELQDEQHGQQFLEKLAAATGGLAFLARERAGLKDSGVRLGRALHSQYVIGYVPPQDGYEGQWRSVRVTAHSPALQVHTRRRYRFE